MQIKKTAVALCLGVGLIGASAVLAAPTLVETIVILGNAKDRAEGSGANQNRLGGFFSDLYYDRSDFLYYGLVDRGPGGGTIGYDARVQQFGMFVHPITGKIAGPLLLKTIFFTRHDGVPLNGFRPDLDPLNGNRSVLGRSFDPEGLVVGRGDHFFVADEYGPAVREFNRKGKLIREFTTPENLIPKQADNSIDYAGARPVTVRGRQDNRGFEGLAMSPDGNTLYGLLQDALLEEGASNDGRRSRNLRMVVYDARSGLPGAQYIYQLESITDINARITAAGSTNTFSATNQGRSIGISAIIALNEHEFLVLERDNRGVGVEDPLGALAVGTKRIYKIDIRGATDVSALSLAGTNDLPAGVTPVTKTLYFDIQVALKSAGSPIPEKLKA